MATVTVRLNNTAPCPQSAPSIPRPGGTPLPNICAAILNCPVCPLPGILPRTDWSGFSDACARKSAQRSLFCLGNEDLGVAGRST